jgi:hypothetical protein
MSTVEPSVIRESFFDADGNAADKDDPSAVQAEIVWLDDDGNEQRTYADLA